MAITLNSQALEHAKGLVRTAVHDEPGDWRDAAPTADEENAFIEKHGYAQYALWHLGIDRDEPEDTKKRYSFPYGDFSKLHRAAVIAIESRAAQNDHDDIAKAAKRLLGQLDD